MSAFDAIWSGSARHIETADDEVALIERAKAGDEPAILRLAESYVSHMRKAITRYTRVLPLDDARQAAFVGFLEAIRAVDLAKTDRLVSIVRPYLINALDAASSEAREGFSVPTRTLERFYNILAQADGDPAAAAKLAPRYEMRESTFWDVYAAVTANESLESALDAQGDAALHAVTSPAEIVDAEDRVLVDLAFAAVNELEREVCRLYYGFTEYDTVPDAEIGHRLGFSRLKVQRTRQRALTDMRMTIAA
ncbi:hypothetical protein Acy02nite_68710 [Actinoplanes cyaneus]|uniref:RNA polymerase sigma factor n=1 Tax=Actinoplanes cyaneus TaxID=52696 RepID=A0A919M447_9ACTN|nr:hypothetical protein [Actinoplanes cyaneus]MCW2139080.1 RNA polymerase sigma factor, sigma-70 family [Actinoplanes cyaneus]GID68990.1 hypothetical protein Acy02nite_68710 [Actinoplanes cyaneus]